MKNPYALLLASSLLLNGCQCYLISNNSSDEQKYAIHLQIWQDHPSCLIGCGLNSLRSRCPDAECQSITTCSNNNIDMVVLRAIYCKYSGWDNWLPWSNCTASCTATWRTRHRRCLDVNGCNGNPTEHIPCALSCNATPISTPMWSLWGRCTATDGDNECGFSIRERVTRSCSTSHCVELSRERESCGSIPCKVRGKWSGWTSWVACNQSCGGGFTFRYRLCNSPGPQGNGQDCKGNSEDKEYCNSHECPVNSLFGPWSDWSTCALPCGKGSQFRKRYCLSSRYGEMGCQGDFSEARNCTAIGGTTCSSYIIAAVTLKLTSLQFNPLLGTTGSPIYNNMTNELTSKLTQAMASVSATVDSIYSMSFQTGSIIASFNIRFVNNIGIEVNLLQNLLDETQAIDNWPVANPLVSISASSPVPPPLSRPTVEAISNTEIHCSWDELPFTTPLITGYVVFYKELLLPFTNWSVIGVPQGYTNITIKYLKQYTPYTIRVAAVTSNDVGLSSPYVDIKTLEGKPVSPPDHIYCLPANHETIFVSWNGPDCYAWNGLQKGYIVRFSKYPYTAFTAWQSFQVNAIIVQVLLDALDSFQWYIIEVAAVTVFGTGPFIQTQCKTFSASIDISPRRIRSANEATPNSVTIEWESMDSRLFGIDISGYKVEYAIIKVGVNDVIPVMVKERVVSPHTTSYVIDDLQEASDVQFRVYGFSSLGDGPISRAYTTESCWCHYDYYVSWVSKPPIMFSETSSLNPVGPLVEYIENLFTDVCGLCQAYRSLELQSGLKYPRMHFNQTKDGSFAFQPNENIMKDSVSINSDIYLPINGHFNVDVFQKDYKFVPLMEESNILLLVRPSDYESQGSLIIGSIISLWPMVLFMTLSAYAAGLVIIILDRFKSEKFSYGKNAINLSFEGFWCAFISMTTVGYGDFIPIGQATRMFTMVWIYSGIVMISILLGSLTSAITLITDNEVPTIFGRKVAVLNSSYEYQFVLRKNGKVDGNVYFDPKDMLRALIEKVVDGVAIDKVMAIDLKTEIDELNIKIGQEYEKQYGYGMVVTGDLLTIYPYLKKAISEKPFKLDTSKAYLDASGSSNEAVISFIEGSLPVMILVLACSAFVGFIVAYIMERWSIQILTFYDKVLEKLNKQRIKKVANKRRIEMEELTEVVKELNENIKKRMKELDRKQTLNLYHCLVLKRCVHYIKGYDVKYSYAVVTKPRPSFSEEKTSQNLQYVQLGYDMQFSQEGID